MNIPLFKIYWDQSDVRSISKAIKAGMNWATGPNIEKFEKNISKYTGRRYTVVFNSGTSALYSVLLSYGFNQDDEIIVPSFTFLSTVDAVVSAGAIPVFADIEKTTYGLNPSNLIHKITTQTKAIIAVHIGGCPCQISKIKKIVNSNKLLLIEDAAESLGARYQNKQVGTFGHSAIISFSAPKVITTGEGGAVITNSKRLFSDLKKLQTQGRIKHSLQKKPKSLNIGYNFRMSNITASLGISQLNKINKLIERRRKNSSYLSKKLSKIKAISTPTLPDSCYSVFQMYTIQVKSGKKTRDSLMKFLINNGVTSKIYFEPVHLNPFYKKTFIYKKGNLPQTEILADQVLTLPMYPTLTRKEMDYIVYIIKKFFNIDK